MGEQMIQKRINMASAKTLAVGAVTFGAALGLLGAGADVYAQDGGQTSASSGPRIESVMVTARKITESAQDVPISMTAITSDLQVSTVRNLTDLNGLSANVRIDADVSRANAASVTIRGISPTRTDDNSFDSPIGIMLDGIYLGSLAGQVLENFDMERVEILRGPQGTLYGRNTVGGVVNAVRTRPTGEWGAKLQYTFGRWDQHEIRSVFNVPVVEDKIALKAFFTTLQRDGYMKNTFLNTTQPQKDYTNFGVTALFTPNDWFEAKITVERFEDKTQGGAFLTNWNFAPGIVPPTGLETDPDYAGGFLACYLGGIIGGGLTPNVPCRTSLDAPAREIRTDFPNDMHVMTTAYTFDAISTINENLKLATILGYRDMVENRKQDFDGTEVDHITLQRDNDYKQFSAEIRLEGSWDTDSGPINAIIGYYYFDQKFEQNWVTAGDFGEFTNRLGGYSLGLNVWTNPDAPLAQLYAADYTPLEACNARLLGAVRCDEVRFAELGNTPYGNKQVGKLYERQNTTAHALFANVDWEFMPGWTAEAGVRWSHEKKHFIGGQAYRTSIDRAFDEHNLTEFADLTNSWTNVSPKASLSWQPGDDMLVYVSYAEGWHSGGFFGVNQNVADFERDQYDPERSRSLEAGFKAQWWDNRLQTNITIFRNQFLDKQESAVQFDDTTNTVVTVFSNVADVIYKGIELEVNAALSEALTVYGTLGLLDADYKDFETDINPNDTCAGVPECIVDATFLNVRNAPKVTAGAGFNYTVIVGNGELSFIGRWAYVSRVDGNLLNQTYSKVPPRNDISASISYEWDKFSITVFGKNLLNERFEAPTIIQPLFATGTIGPGFSWGIEIGGEF